MKSGFGESGFLIQTAQAEFDRKYKRSVWVRVIAASALQTLCSGVVYGWQGILPVLVMEGVYANLCESYVDLPPGRLSSLALCEEQTLALNRIYQITGSLTSVSGVLLAMLSSRLGPRRSCALGSIFFVISFLFFALFHQPHWNSTMQVILLPTFYTLGSLGGYLIYISCMSYQFAMRPVAVGAASWVNSLLTSCWDLSAMIFYLFYQIYINTELTMQTIFLVYTAILILPLAVFSWFCVPPVYRVLQGTDSSSGSAGRLSQKPTHTHGFVSSTYIDPMELREPASVWALVCTRWVLVPWAAACFSLLTINFYCSTVFDQAYWITEGDAVLAGELNELFAILLPVLGFMCTIFIAPLVSRSPDRRTAWRGYFVCGTLCVFWAIFSVMPYKPFFYISQVVFVPFRMLFFITNYAYFEESFSEKKYPVLAFGACTLSGLFAFIDIPLNAAVYSVPGEFFYVNLVIGCTAALSLLAAAVLAEFGFKGKPLRSLGAECPEADFSDDDAEHWQPLPKPFESAGPTASLDDYDADGKPSDPIQAQQRESQKYGTFRTASS